MRKPHTATSTEPLELPKPQMCQPIKTKEETLREESALNSPSPRAPSAARHNLKTLDQALVDKVAAQKKTMSIRQICVANNMRQGDVAWLLYVAPKQLAG